MAPLSPLAVGGLLDKDRIWVAIVEEKGSILYNPISSTVISALMKIKEGPCGVHPLSRFDGHVAK